MASYLDEYNFRVYTKMAICLVVVFIWIVVWGLGGGLFGSLICATLAGVLAYIFFKMCDETNGEITKEELARIMRENEE